MTFRRAARFPWPRHSRGPMVAYSTSTARNTTWGFIGLGRMGFPMATHLRARIPKQDLLLISDKNSKAIDAFLDACRNGRSHDIKESIEGVEFVSDVGELAKRATTIFTVLPEPSHVLSVFDWILGAQAANRANSTGKLFIDCSTIDPATSISIGSRVHDQLDSAFVDAPMSGGVVGAQAATLTFMLGAPPSLVPRLTTTLRYMGSRVLHLGPPGAGLAGKLANNYLLAISQIATAEAMNLGIKLGLDGKKLGELINSSTGRCWASEANNPVPGVSNGAPCERDFAGGFGVGLMKKDLRIALEAANEVDAELVLGKKAQAIYDEVWNEEGQKDFGVVYKWLAKKGRRD